MTTGYAEGQADEQGEDAGQHLRRAVYARVVDDAVRPLVGDQARITVVSINVVVWVLVSATTAHLIYPWPLWVAGPWGIVLLGVTAIARTIRRGGRG